MASGIQQTAVRAAQAIQTNAIAAGKVAGQWGSKAITVLTDLTKAGSAHFMTGLRAFIEFAGKAGNVALDYLKSGASQTAAFCSRNSREISFMGAGAAIALAVSYVASRFISSAAPEAPVEA
ncbi:MAG: hypothetical protein S4CHLAM37_10510 [Chlamydiia bacterium]|nr:hypothetical protein [Chlamydiia bacterium]